MAQVGSRLIDAAAGKITEDFFKAFEAHLRAGAETADTAETTQTVEPSAAAVTAAPAGGNRIWWIAAAAVVLAAIYFLSR